MDVGMLVSEILRRFGAPSAIACDPDWREAELRDALRASRVPVADSSLGAWVTRTVPKTCATSAERASRDR